jgi:hypothetical protein
MRPIVICRCVRHHTNPEQLFKAPRVSGSFVAFIAFAKAGLGALIFDAMRQHR